LPFPALATSIETSHACRYYVYAAYR